jgi:signal transduction histidine kinase
MKRMPLFYRLLLFSILLIAISVSFSSWIIFEQDKIVLEQSLAKELLAIVRSASPLVDGDLHELVQLAPDGSIARREQFEYIRQKLLAVKAANLLPSKRGSPIYTLRKAADFATSGELEFVVMTDVNAEGKFFTGYRYRAEPHNLRALAGEASASRIYQDEEGTWISACCPIRDGSGQVVGLLQADRPVDFFYDESRRQALFLLTSAGVSGLAAALLAIFFARGLVLPIEALVKAHRDFGSGAMSTRMAVNRGDEIGNLMSSFNHMADGLSAANQKLAEYNRTLEQKVEERTQQLQQKNAELMTMNNEKNEFLGIAAHDLKNPLSGIIGYADMVKELPDLPREEINGFMGNIMHQANRMLNLVTNLLDVNAIERGQMKVTLAPMKLTPTVQAVAATYALRAKDKFIHMHEDYAEEGSMIFADEEVVTQILDNLISNAVKYSPTHKNIYLRVESREGKVRFTVRDEGPGLSVEDMQKLFGKFARLTARPTAGESSTGLGLSIVKRMVEALQGRVWCESELGDGASFIIEFAEHQEKRSASN